MNRREARAEFYRIMFTACALSAAFALGSLKAVGLL